MKKIFMRIGALALIVFVVLILMFNSLRVVVEREVVTTGSGGYGSVEYYRPFDPDKPTEAELNAEGYYKDTDGVYRKKN